MVSLKRFKRFQTSVKQLTFYDVFSLILLLSTIQINYLIKMDTEYRILYKFRSQPQKSPVNFRRRKLELTRAPKMANNSMASELGGI